MIQHKLFTGSTINRFAQVLSGAGIGLFTGIDRRGNLALLLLNQSFAFFNVLRPLVTATVIVLLAAIDVLVYLLFSLLCQFHGTLFALLSQVRCSLFRVHRRGDNVFARLFAGLGRIQHSYKCTYAQTCQKPSQSTYTVVVI